MARNALRISPPSRARNGRRLKKKRERETVLM